MRKLSINTYLVGGAVRDRLLGLVVEDRDWVVVGSTPAEMVAQGFKPVGQDFPVFLHPKTHEEYALARTERKVAPGYQGFTFNTDREVTLEQDLQRRDLTINAMAETKEGDVIDPFGGQIDLKAGVLRHVSPAFVEDPLRIVRVARFAARFAERFNFTVADETLLLMQKMVSQGEVDALVPERIWQELERALMTPTPSQFLNVLRQCGALVRILPEIDALYGVVQNEKSHPEVDCGKHIELCLDAAAKMEADIQVRFALLTHDLGKACTPVEQWPHHPDHDQAGLVPLQNLCQRLRVPKVYRTLAQILCREHINIHRIGRREKNTSPQEIVALLERCQAFRRPERLAQIIMGCSADIRGRLGRGESLYPQGDILMACFQAAKQVETSDLSAHLEGAAIAEAIRMRRIEAVRAVKVSKQGGRKPAI